MTQKKEGSQRERFIETARALGCDEDEEAFDEKLKAIAKQKVKPNESDPKPWSMP